MSLSVTVRAREFQVAGAEQWKALLPKAVLKNGSDSAVADVLLTVPGRQGETSLSVCVFF